MARLVLQADQRIDQAIGSLAAATAILLGTKIDANREQGMKVFRAKLGLYYRAKTADEGPIVWGIACNVADAAALAGILTDDEQSGFGDAKQGGMEWWKVLGMIPRLATESPLDKPDSVFVDVKINWVIPEGSKMNVFAFNMDSTALTTGTLLDYYLDWSGVWLRD